MPANTGKNRRKMPEGRKWVKGQSGNPAGAPKRGESWAEVIKQIGDMTAEEVKNLIASWIPTLNRVPKGVTMKQLVVIRAYVALANEPSASLMNAFMDRAEGKVPDRTQMEGKLTVLGLDEMLERVYGNSGH